MSWQADEPADYIEATSGKGTTAAGSVMERLAERLLAAPSADAKLAERKAAAEAVVEIASNSDRPEAVVNHAKNEAGSVAQKTSTKKAVIADPIEERSRDLRRDVAKAGISLDHGYGLDKYLEKDLVRVEKVESTDHHNDPLFRWVFSDGVVVETNSGLPYEWYPFWKRLVEATDKQLLPQFASEEIGDPEKDPDYPKLSLGPESRPWSEHHYITCLNDLVTDRVEHVETVGPRTEVWEAVCRYIGRSRAVTDLETAVSNRAVHAYHDDNGDLAEIWVPTATINSECSEHDVEPRALQNEVVARGADSDELAGRSVAEPQTVGQNTQRYWRLDATHDAVPEPDEIVDELTAPTDSIEGMDWGDTDE